MINTEGQLPLELLFAAIREPQFTAQDAELAALKNRIHDVQVNVDELSDDFSSKQGGQEGGARMHLLKKIHESVVAIAAEAPKAAIDKDDRKQLAQWLDRVNELLSFFEVEQLT